MTEIKRERDFLIWLHYNSGPNVDLLINAELLPLKFKEAIAGTHKYCKCKDKPRAVNHLYWKDWHCTYCLKPKKEETK